MERSATGNGAGGGGGLRHHHQRLAVLCRHCSGRPVSYDLEQAFADRIIGGPGAFVVTADSTATFADAVRKKLILEIAEAGPRRALARLGEAAGKATVRFPADARASAPAVAEKGGERCPVIREAEAVAKFLLYAGVGDTLVLAIEGAGHGRKVRRLEVLLGGGATPSSSAACATTSCGGAGSSSVTL